MVKVNSNNVIILSFFLNFAYINYWMIFIFSFVYILLD